MDGRVAGAGGWRGLLVIKRIGTKGVELIAVEILIVFIKEFTFLVR